jgi:hypothetical protein
LDNSTNIDEEESVSRSFGTVNGIFALLFLIALFSISMTARRKEKKVEDKEGHGANYSFCQSL